MKYIRDGNKEKAEKFVKKAGKLFPSRRIQEIMNLVQQMDSQSASEPGPGQAHKRNGHREAGAEHDNEEATTSNANYTQEQVEAVKRIRKCKNYYEMLGVSKDSSESELKKSYRKLALAFHPDQNSAPGASEALKAVCNAYAVLSDAEKKRQYDLCGDEEPVRSRRSHHQGFYEYGDPSHGVQADMTAEEIFNMFFSGGSPGSSVQRSGREQQEEHGGHHDPASNITENKDEDSHGPANNSFTATSAAHKTQELFCKKTVNGHNHTSEIYDGQLGDFLKEAVEIICGDVARLELEVRRQEEAGAGILARTAGLGEDIRQYRHQLADTRTQHTAWLKQSAYSFQNNRNGEK